MLTKHVLTLKSECASLKYKNITVVVRASCCSEYVELYQYPNLQSSEHISISTPSLQITNGVLYEIVAASLTLAFLGWEVVKTLSYFQLVKALVFKIYVEITINNIYYVWFESSMGNLHISFLIVIKNLISTYIWKGVGFEKGEKI